MPQNNTKKNTYRIIIPLFLIATFSVGYFLLVKNQTGIENPPIEIKEEVISFYINSQLLIENKNNNLISTNLRPTFEIYVPKNIDYKEIKLFLDDFGDVLNDAFYGTTSWNENNHKLEFVPSFAIKPRSHIIRLSYQESTEEKEQEYLFTLIYHETFQIAPKDSKVWIIPVENPTNWFSINKNERLFGTPNTEDGHASLAYIYPFHNEFSADMEIIPLGEKINFVVYSINSTRNEFVIGNDGHEKNILFHRSLDGGLEVIFGKNFALIPYNRYHLRLENINSRYRLSIRKLDSDEQVKPNENIDEAITLVEFFETDNYSDSSIQIGIALQKGSDGVIVDDFFVSGR